MILTFLIGIGVLCVPLQHYMPLARSQHVAISMAWVAAGFALQAGWSFRKVGIWGKATLMGSCAFYGSFAYFLWMNAWLGNIELATTEQHENSRRFIMVLLAASVPLFSCWWMWRGEMKQSDGAAQLERTRR